jgi:hypothetical protein
MKFNNEEEFRQWVAAELPKHLGQRWTVLHGKNVSDIVLCRDDDTQPLILFVEVKYHKTSHGRIGFGNASGRGYQTEILLKRPFYLERYLRWLVTDQDSEQCLFFSNDDVRNNCAGEIKEGKQNNFTSGLFEKNRTRCFKLADAPQQIAKWAKGEQPQQGAPPDRQ